MGETPAAGSSYWEAPTSFNKYVAYEQTGQTTINHVKAVWAQDPRLVARPRRVGFWTNAVGVQVDPSAPNEVWIEFRRLAPRYTATEWSILAEYVAGDVVYVASSGECYEALQAGVGQDPVTETAYWDRQDVPYVLADVVKELAYADLLREDGQNEKARAQTAEALNLLADMELVEINQQDQADAAMWRRN